MQRDVADALLDLAEADEDAAHAHARSKAAAKVTFADVVLLAETESVDLPAAVASYLKEPDATSSSSTSGAVTVAQLRSQLQQARRKRRKKQRKEASTEAWKKFMQQPASTLPERMKLADVVTALDDKDTDAARALIVTLAREAPLEIGLWGGIKRVWKRAEERHDYALWAALTAAIEQRAGSSGDVGYGTARYVGKRAWRVLRDLGRASPEMFPHVAVELLRHYDRWGTCTSKVCSMREPDPLLSTWKSSPEPLLRLLEGARVDVVAKFAVDQLKKHHAEAVRGLSPARLARLVEGELQLGSVHELFLELVEKASLPLAQLRDAGLHEAALKMLFSPSAKARAWAVEYARNHAKDLAVDRVIDLVRRGNGDAQKLGLALLEAMPSSTPGLALDTLAQLLSAAPAASAIVEKKLRERLTALDSSFDEQARVAFLVECVLMGNAQLKLASTFLLERMQARELWPAEVWLRVLADERTQWNHAAAAQQALASLNGGDPVAVLDANRLLDVVLKKADVHIVGLWFAKAARANALDVESVKGLVFASKTRALALSILGNRRLVKPLDLGLGWLLALAKRADPDLHRFAYQTLLEHTAPADFAPAGTPADTAVDAGVARLFAMATGAAENENTRSFAQTYLRCHHPVLGPVDAQAKQLGLKPQLTRDAYTVERTWRALFDHREDVRRFAAAVAKVEMRAWGVQRRLFELCESDDKLVRNVALDAMMKAGDDSADPETTLTLDELSADAIFPLSESTKKSVRDAGMELIRKHYARLGGVERLSWLMQSAEREVRAFAVRLLWEKHRPRATPSTWKPRATTAGHDLSFDDAGRFVDGNAMRGFLRRVLFSLPPGAGPHVDDDGSAKKSVPASVAKRRLVDVVRDVAVEDAAFAAIVRPVLAEMTGSLARGEWQACLAALAAIDAAAKRRGDDAADVAGSAARASLATTVRHGGEA